MNCIKWIELQLHSSRGFQTSEIITSSSNCLQNHAAIIRHQPGFERSIVWPSPNAYTNRRQLSGPSSIASKPIAFIVAATKLLHFIWNLKHFFKSWWLYTIYYIAMDFKIFQLSCFCVLFKGNGKERKWSQCKDEVCCWLRQWKNLTVDLMLYKNNSIWDHWLVKKWSLYIDFFVAFR